MKSSALKAALTALAVAGLLATAGCSSSSSASSSAASAAPSTDEGLAAAQAFSALPPAEQEQQLQVVTASLDRQLLTLSGLEAELGGAAKADAAYADLSANARQFAQNLVDRPDFGKFGAFLPAEDAPSQGGLMFANYMAAALLQDAAVNEAKDVAPGTRSEPDGKDLSDPNSGGKGAIKATGDVKQSALEVGGEFTVDGVTGKLKTIITVSPCPDPQGQFTSKTSMSASIASGAGTGSNLTIDIEIKGQVDDDAHLVSYDTDTRTQSAKFENSKGQFVDSTVGWTVTGKDWSGYRGKVNRTGGNVTDAFITDQSKWSLFMAIMMQDKAVEAAKAGWESGRCVTLEPTTSPSKRTGLEPSTVVTITAAPRSKIDGGAVGGTVTATLSGDTAVDPAGSKVKADAKFTYVAPGEKDKSASVALEARSKRGVAKADVAFDTKAGGYVASGGGSGIVVSGTVPDLTAAFTLTGTGTGFTVTFDYTPTDPNGRSGTLRYSGKGGGVTLKGTGDYTIAGNDGEVLTITSNNQGCATPGGCRSHVETITLTPTS